MTPGEVALSESLATGDHPKTIIIQNLGFHLLIEKKDFQIILSYYLENHPQERVFITEVFPRDGHA